MTLEIIHKLNNALQALTIALAGDTGWPVVRREFMEEMASNILAARDMVARINDAHFSNQEEHMNQYNTPEKLLERAMLKNRLLTVLNGHVGRGKVIGMGELFESVYGEDVAHRINDTRRLRSMITELRKEGIPVVSTVAQSEGGYYIASSDSELTDYCNRLKDQALKKLAQIARLKKVGLPTVISEIHLNMTTEVPAHESAN